MQYLIYKIQVARHQVGLVRGAYGVGIIVGKGSYVSCHFIVGGQGSILLLQGAYQCLPVYRVLAPVGYRLLQAGRIGCVFIKVFSSGCVAYIIKYQVREITRFAIWQVSTVNIHLSDI
jgi:hypothetical protein